MPQLKRPSQSRQVQFSTWGSPIASTPGLNDGRTGLWPDLHPSIERRPKKGKRIAFHGGRLERKAFLNEWNLLGQASLILLRRLLNFHDTSIVRKA
jgi:hypothetical protein